LIARCSSHRCVAGRGFVEWELEVVNVAGVDLAVPDQVDQTARSSRRPAFPTTTSSPGCSRPPTSSAPAGSARSPLVGELTLDWDALTSDAEPDQQLIVYTAEPGSRSEQALRELATSATKNIEAPQ
jgi:hypothetical protein